VKLARVGVRERERERERRGETMQPAVEERIVVVWFRMVMY